MAQENCPFAYHKQGDISTHCTKQQKPYDYCLQTYYCTKSQRYEAVRPSQKCRLRKEA